MILDSGLLFWATLYAIVTPPTFDKTTAADVSAKVVFFEQTKVNVCFVLLPGECAV